MAGPSAPKGGAGRSAAPRTSGSRARTVKLQTTSSPPPAGGDWHASVETRFGQLGGDVRNLLIGGAAVAAALVAAGWGAYAAVTNDLKNLAVSQKEISGRIETLDAKLSGRLDLMEQRLAAPTQVTRR